MGLMTTLERLKQKRQIRDDLTAIMETPHGKRFFKQFLKDCGVTRSRFSLDPYEITAAEATRRLAMSYLHLLGKDDPQHLINIIEED
jgi:hypothetical protein